MDSDVSPSADLPLSVRLLDTRWEPRPGITVDQVRTYGWGLGSEYAYCYSFPAHMEIAQLKGEQRFRIKVGSAKGDPLQRIFAQFATNKTAISDSLVVLLLFKTLSASHLERWLHKRLERAGDAVGSEWFLTNSDELVALFAEYVRTAAAQSSDAVEPIETSPGPKREPRKSRAERAPKVRSDDETIPETRTGQGHRIQAVMESGLFTPEEIVKETGLSADRVWSHINYEVDKKRAELNADNRVVVLSRPKYRAR